MTALLAVGCDDTHHARVSQGAGLHEGSPVLVSGVRVGEVEAVTVIEGQVDVELSIASDHQVTLRQDSCVLAAAGDGEPTLVLVPGTGAPREGEAPIPECALPADAVSEAMRGLGEGVQSLLRSLAEGMRDGMRDAPRPPPASPPPASPPPASPATGDICEGVTLRLDGVEPVSPVPLHLPNGGQRVWIVVENPSDRTLQLGPLNAATFADGGGRALTPAGLPGSDAWFMPVRVPAHGSARVNVVFPAAPEPRIDRIEVRNTRPADAVGEVCTVQAFGLAG